MGDARTRAARYANRLKQCLNLGGWWRREARYHSCDRDVHKRTDGADALGRDAKPPMLRGVGSGVHELEPDQVGKCEREAREHAGNGAFAIHASAEDAEQNRREERRRGESEGKRDHLCDEPGRIDPEIARNPDGDGGGDARVGNPRKI